MLLLSWASPESSLSIPMSLMSSRSRLRASPRLSRYPGGGQDNRSTAAWSRRWMNIHSTGEPCSELERPTTTQAFYSKTYNTEQYYVPQLGLETGSLMQPETAFWLLSATAQSSAALAGLAALLWVFFRQAWKKAILAPSSGPGEVVRLRTERWSLVLHGSSVSVLVFVAAPGISLTTLGLVSPGSDPVGLPILVLATLSVNLTILGGLIMFSYVSIAERKLFKPYTGPMELEPVDEEDFDGD